MDEGRLRTRMTSDDNKYKAMPHGNYSIVGSARAEDYRLVFNKRGSDGTGKANLVQDKSNHAEGIIYCIDLNGMSRLDIDEGVSSGHYRRDDVFEVLMGGKKITCFIYLAEKIEGGLKPTKEYLDYLLKGRNYLSSEYYEKLSKTEIADNLQH